MSNHIPGMGRALGAKGQARHMWCLPRIPALVLVSCRMFSVLRNTMSTWISSFCHHTLRKRGRAEATILLTDKWSPVLHAQLKVLAQRHRARWSQDAHSEVPGSLCDEEVPLPSGPCHTGGAQGACGCHCLEAQAWPCSLSAVDRCPWTHVAT